MLLLSMQWFGETGFLLPNWAWVAIAAVVLVLVILIIVLALKGKRRKNAEEKNEALSKTIYSEQQSQPVREEQSQREEEGPTTLTPVEEKPVEKKAEEPAKKPAAKKTTATKTAAKSTAKPAAKSTTAKTATKTTSKPAAKTAAKTAAKPAPKAEEKDDGKVYHISRRKDENKWQIKAEGGAKAIKLFNTQAEAIEYAKQLADNQDARIMIHKADGSFRRLDYKS